MKWHSFQALISIDKNDKTFALGLEFLIEMVKSSEWKDIRSIGTFNGLCNATSYMRRDFGDIP